MKTLSALILAGLATYASAAITIGSQTITLKEINGVPGNECLTFRNNGNPALLSRYPPLPLLHTNPALGEIVDAACVTTSSDRQITPSTSSTGQSVLFVNRAFSAGFRPDLVGKQPCVGFNGTDFKALDCNAAGTVFVSLVGGQLKAGTACDSGHDGKAQLTVDTAGKTCASFTVLGADGQVVALAEPAAAPVASVSASSSAAAPVATGAAGGGCAAVKGKRGWVWVG